MKLPICSVQDGPRLVRCMREYGFVYLSVADNVNQVCQDGLEAMRRFFESPQENKDKILMQGAKTAFRGYQRVGQNVTDGAQDMHEGFDIMRTLPKSHDRQDVDLKVNGENLWPQNDPQFKTSVMKYVDTMLALGHEVMNSIHDGMKQDQDDTQSLLLLNPKLYEDPFWIMRGIMYPKKVEGATGSMGCGSHTDYGLLTMIASEPVPGCLEIFHQDKWIPVEPIPGHLIINIGDVLEFWTKQHFIATPHRVLCPTERSRLSMPFFFEPNPFASIKPDGSTYLDHLKSKSESNFKY